MHSVLTYGIAFSIHDVGLPRRTIANMLRDVLFVLL